MKPILEKLHTDHINFSKLLNYLEGQLKIIENLEHSNLASIFDAIRYMKEYSDFVHHPLENVIFKYFLEHRNIFHHEIGELLHEHDELPLLTDKLLNILQEALAGEPQERQVLIDYLKNYISVQKQHMNYEEANVYPALNAELKEDDWKNIRSELAHIDDPLFGDRVEKSYQSLYQQIVS